MRRVTIFFYNLLFIPILLILLPGYLVRIRKRGGYGNKALQRFGIFDRITTARIGQQRIWIHAVSVGEVGIALKFASKFHHRNPESRFLISTTTSTGLAILERSASDWLEPVANPIDFPFITSRLIRHLRPSAFLMVEADLWPNRIAACKSLGIPVALLNARLSSRSEKRFRMAQSFTAPFFNQLDLITLTDPADEARWISLGVKPALLHLTGNIKHDSSDCPAYSRGGDFILDSIFLAASTHQGEEQEITTAWLTIKKEFPNLRLVITPRHVERREEIRSTLKKLEIPCRLRSEGADLSEDPLLLDTTGELSSWYPRSTIVFVGKSLTCSVNRGGQNMIEPLQAGAPVLIGPHTGNFEPLATQLCEAGAAIRVNDQQDIIDSVRSLLGNAEKRTTMIAASSTILAPHQGATVKNCELVEKLLLRLQSSSFSL
jgi:3-deoxy-D-manno-octulosonic-acid transferase